MPDSMDQFISSVYAVNLTLHRIQNIQDVDHFFFLGGGYLIVGFMLHSIFLFSDCLQKFINFIQHIIKYDTRAGK